jgi:hypothetical protein
MPGAAADVGQAVVAVAAVVDLKDGEGRVEGEEHGGSEDGRSGMRGVELTHYHMPL